MIPWIFHTRNSYVGQFRQVVMALRCWKTFLFASDISFSRETYSPWKRANKKLFSARDPTSIHVESSGALIARRHFAPSHTQLVRTIGRKFNYLFSASRPAVVDTYTRLCAHTYTHHPHLNTYPQICTYVHVNVRSMRARFTQTHTHTRARHVDVWEVGRKMDGEVVLSPVVHPPKSTAAAYNVYPFSGSGHRLPLPHSRRSPFFGALNYRPELQNSGLERVVCTRVRK